MIMNTDKVFRFIKAKPFFTVFCPGVTNWINKMRGADGRGKPIDFSPADRRMIRTAIAEMKRSISAPDQRKRTK